MTRKLRTIFVASIFVIATIPATASAQYVPLPGDDDECRTINISITICGEENRRVAIAQAVDYLVDGLTSLFVDSESAEITDVRVDEQSATETEFESAR